MPQVQRFLAFQPIHRIRGVTVSLLGAVAHLPLDCTAVAVRISLPDAVEVSDEGTERIAAVVEIALQQLRSEKDEPSPEVGPNRPAGLLSPLKTRQRQSVLPQGGSFLGAPPGADQPT